MTLSVRVEGHAAGAANMAADEALARAVAAGAIGPAVRLYGWAPPAVSLGHHQDEDDVDAAALAREGIGLVRRPTGGRAILHWNELTYCAALPVSLGSPRDVYAMVNEAVLEGILALGIPAELCSDADDLRAARSSADGVPCFSFSARSEIRAGGRKLVGSAQRRYEGAILQHGSFLLGPEHRQLARFVRARGQETPEAFTARIAGAMEARTTDASTLVGRPVGFDEAARALAAGFERNFSRTPRPGDRPRRPPAPVNSLQVPA